MKYVFIGWNKDEENNKDKIWASILIKEFDRTDGWPYYNTYLTVWGRRGKKLSNKIVTTSPQEMQKLIGKKNDKGYIKILKTDLDTVYPEFETDLEQTAIWATLMV